MCRICEMINNVSSHAVAIIIVVVATDLVTRVLSAFTFTFCAFTFTDRTDKIHSPAEFITAAICTIWLWCRLFQAPTRTTSSVCLMLHRLALVVWAGCPLLPPLPPRQHPQCPPVARTVKTNASKKRVGVLIWKIVFLLISLFSNLVTYIVIPIAISF